MAEQSKTVDAALRLLDILGTEPAEGRATPPGGGGLDGSAAGFARRLDLSRTAVGRILATLEAHSLARRTDRGWDIGLGVLSLAGRIEPVLRSAARPALESLAARFGETAVLAVRDGSDVVAIDQVVGARRLVQVRYRPGSRHRLAVAAHGRALLPEAAAVGHAVARDQPEPGVVGVAAPVYTRLGEAPVASVGLVIAAHRFTDESVVVAAVRDAARMVTTDLGARRRPTEGGGDAVLPPRR